MGLEDFKLKKIQGYGKRLLQKAPPHLEPYAMLEISGNVHDAIMKVKNIQQQHGNGNVLIGFGRALSPTVERVAKEGSSIIQAVGDAIHSILGRAGDYDQNIVESIGDASSKVITLVEGAIPHSLSGFGKFFHGFLGTRTWMCILIFIIVRVVFMVYQ